MTACNHPHSDLAGVLVRADSLELPAVGRMRHSIEALAAGAVEALGARPKRPLLIVPDRTREIGAAELVNAVIDALGTEEKLPCIFASGTHAPMSATEMAPLTTAVGGRILPLAHDCDQSTCVDGINAALFESDGIIALSGMSFHYLAGFGGGRKMLLPGVADRATATAVHQRSLVVGQAGRPAGVAPGCLEDNPFHQEIVARLQRTSSLPPLAGICVVRSDGKFLDGEAGDLLEHHRTLSQRFCDQRTVLVDPPGYDGVFVTAPPPTDATLVQAHKALLAASKVVRAGGRLALRADCARGLGHAKMRDWLKQSASVLREQLDEQFEIGKQTAWSIKSLLEEFEVGICSALDPADLRAFGATPLQGEASCAAFLQSCDRVAVAPQGAALRYRLG